MESSELPQAGSFKLNRCILSSRYVIFKAPSSIVHRGIQSTRRGCVLVRLSVRHQLPIHRKVDVALFAAVWCLLQSLRVAVHVVQVAPQPVAASERPAADVAAELRPHTIVQRPVLCHRLLVVEALVTDLTKVESPSAEQRYDVAHKCVGVEMQ